MSDDELREQIADIIEEAGAHWESTTYWKLPQRPRADEQAEALMPLIATAREVAVLDYVMRKEVARVKVEFTNQPIFDAVIATACREAQAAQRERDAVIAEEHADGEDRYWGASTETLIAAAIRSTESEETP